MKACGLSISFAASLFYLPIGMMIGMLPISIGGIGTRDAAFLVLFEGQDIPERIALIGLICTFRIWIGGIMGFLYYPKGVFFKK